MFQKILLYLKNFDWILFLAVFLLLLFGLAEIYSIALGNDELSLLNFKKQAFFILLGILLLFVIAFIDFDGIKSFGNYLYLIAGALLAAVLFLGTEIRGTTGWFNIFGFGIQPVEIVKVLLLVYLAKYFSNANMDSFLRHLAVSGISVIVLAGLVLLQPDFGSAMILLLVWSSMLFIIGFPVRYLLLIGVSMSIIFVIGWFSLFEDYQKQRIMTFVNPNANSLTEGYNVNQAIIAVGSGRLIGRGIGFGSQSQLKFLPESQNDFIFAVIAEELGFLGVLLILCFFGLIFFRLILAAKRAKNNFASLFLLGAVVLIFIQMFINIGMNIGLLPVIGISLPFVSYGGSAIISSLIMIGIAQNIIIKSKLKY